MVAGILLPNSSSDHINWFIFIWILPTLYYYRFCRCWSNRKKLILFFVTGLLHADDCSVDIFIYFIIIIDWNAIQVLLVCICKVLYLKRNGFFSVYLICVYLLFYVWLTLSCVCLCVCECTTRYVNI